MSDLAATNCGCGNGCGSSCGNNLLFLLLILCAVFLRALHKKDFMQMMGGEQE